jgi:hypothetical protein
MADEQLKVNAPQEGALVGDEAVNGAADQSGEVHDYRADEDAQVVAERSSDADTVQVREVRVATDKFILDPSSPEAVQIPDAGIGSLDLPIHDLAGPTPEDYFAENASELVEVTDEHREQAALEGRNATDVAADDKS